jgi:hypothetical protein
MMRIILKIIDVKLYFDTRCQRILTHIKLLYNRKYIALYKRQLSKYIILFASENIKDKYYL